MEGNKGLFETETTKGKESKYLICGVESPYKLNQKMTTLGVPIQRTTINVSLTKKAKQNPKERKEVATFCKDLREKLSD